MTIIDRVGAAYAWQRALGHEAVRGDLCWVVTDRQHRDVWAANHVSSVRARSAAEIDAVLHHAEAGLAHCAHRLFVVDAATPPEFVARLALDGYAELTPTLQMVLDGPLLAEPAPVDLRPVQSEVEWQCLAALVRQDHAEGARTHGEEMPESVTQGIVASYRKKWPAYQFFLARADAVDCAYGASVACPNGLGMVEDLFTLPSFRRRGIATAIIATAVNQARARGADTILIGALASEPPKHLYAALGFAPVCVTREYIRHLHRPQSLTG